MTKKQQDEITKFLSYILRHEPNAIGIPLDTDGWADINELIQCAQTQGRILDRNSIQEVVDTNDKKRFSISEDGQRIRAAQGHSTTTVNLQYTEQTPPEFLYHGTATRFLEAIKEKGLISGKRHHVHLSHDKQTAIEVGKRYGKPVVLKIAALRMHQRGCKFFQADNGVWLSEHIPTEFIQENS